MPRALNSLRALGLLLIDPLEVIENRATLVCRQAAKLVPVRLAELRRVLARRVSVHGRELLVALCGLRLALVAVLALILLERAARIEEPPEELLLTRERRSVDSSPVEGLGELTRLL